MRYRKTANRAKRMHSRKPRHPLDVLTYIAVGFLALLVIVPLLYILDVSVSSTPGIYTDLFSFIDDFRLVENYSGAWTTGRISLYMKNTVIVLAGAVSIVVVTTSLFAYSLRRYKFREVQLSYYFLLGGFFIPVQVIIIPLFKILSSIQLTNSLLGLILVYAATNLPLSMMLFVGYFKSIPKELDESATIDGCGPYAAYWRIILPLSKAIVATVIILAGLNIWRDFFIPLVLVSSPYMKTLSVGLLSFKSEFSIDWTRMCAAMVMQTVPIIVLFLLLQKHFVSGAVAGAVKK